MLDGGQENGLGPILVGCVLPPRIALVENVKKDVPPIVDVLEIGTLSYCIGVALRSDMLKI